MSIDITDPDIKAAIAAAVEEATAPLIAKKDELLGELKKARKGQQVDPEVVTRLEDQIETLKGERDTALRTAKTATTDAEKARKALEASEGFTSRLLVDNGLSDALSKAGVTNAVHIKAAKAMLSAQVQLVADGDNKVARVGDKTLADYVTEWAKGDEGKYFVAAANNSGGGAAGGGGSQHNADLSKLKPVDRITAARAAAKQ